MTKLTLRQQRAIECLLTERTITDAARVAGVGRTTLHGWLQTEQFRTELNSSADEVLAASVRRLTALSADAVDALRDALKTDTKTPVRLRAADVTLSKLMHLKEFAELERRISALEGKTR